MAVRNLDVVSDGPSIDVPVLRVRNALPSALIAINISDMVLQIRQTLGTGNALRRLRIFGHAGPGLQCVGDVPATLTLNSGPDLYLNGLKVIYAREGRLLNQELLAHLTPLFDRGGWVELHGCKVAAEARGEQLLKCLADLWQVPVKGGTEDQIAGGGLEGTSIIARPGRPIERRTFSPLIDVDRLYR